MDQELNPEKHQLLFRATQILSHSEQFSVVFWMKMIQSKLDYHPIHPYILSYKYALNAILDQKF